MRTLVVVTGTTSVDRAVLLAGQSVTVEAQLVTVWMLVVYRISVTTCEPFPGADDGPAAAAALLVPLKSGPGLAAVPLIAPGMPEGPRDGAAEAMLKGELGATLNTGGTPEEAALPGTAAALETAAGGVAATTSELLGTTVAMVLFGKMVEVRVSSGSQVSSVGLADGRAAPRAPREKRRTAA